jgi:two-component system cell cycle sensor histidine kinase/response regulator CckA
MAKSADINEFEKRILVLETQIKHLTNELTIANQETNLSTKNYFDIYTKIEKKVEERSAQLRDLQQVMTVKSQELELMLDTSPAAIFYKDRRQRYIRVNRKFSELFGIPVQKIKAKTHNELLNANSDDLLSDDAEIMRTGRPIFRKNVTIETHIGKRHLLIDKIPRKDINGKVIGIIGFILDVTDLKKAEEEKRKLQEKLVRSEKMEAIGTLAGGIAHDFNNLLMGIQGRVSLLLIDINPSHPHYEHITGIEKSVENATNLTKQLLGFARGGKYEVKSTDINMLVQKSAEMFGRTRKEIALYIKHQEGVCIAEVDKSQIEQVLLNLYLNAWQAMPGGGELYVKTENITLDEDFIQSNRVEPGNYVKISITDTGVGIDKNIQKKIFDPFFTTKECGSGSGLGLASAYGIVKNHGGTIEVMSEKGSGSTFNIYLPATEKCISEDEKLDSKISKGSETILLVDDEDMFLDIGQLMLQNLGYTVMTAQNGRQAVTQFTEHQTEINMVILDIIMPHMGGSETYDKLKEINPEIKILLASGYSIEGQATEILNRGCNGFIQKPFNLSQLSQKIREILKDSESSLQ